ncbi:MAG TPA: lysoplasmalogenase [Polyangia bacterium]|nr:lysoplasmalogenase [Polyangia bacterium]
MFAPPPLVGTLLVVVFGALAITGAETGRRVLLYLGKPAATLSLLLIVGMPPGDRFATMITVGILFNLLGDIFLLSDADLPFMIAVPLVLTGHIFYTVAFFGAAASGGWWPLPWPSFVIAVFTVSLVVLLWPGLGIMKIPVLVYALAITTMVVSALKTVGGPLSPLAAGLAVVGAMLFYLSDSNLAWNRFRHPYAHAAAVTLSTYWLGQLGIAWSSRLASGG